MVSLPPHLQARPASRREDSNAEKAIDDLLARRPAVRVNTSIEDAFLIQNPRDLKTGIARFRALVAGKSLRQLLETYRGRGSLLDLLV